MLDGLPNLEITALRDNPCMEPDPAKALLELLASMQCMRRPDCKLTVIDREVCCTADRGVPCAAHVVARGVVVQITVSERVEAWRTAGGDYHEIVDNLRLDIAIGIRAPSHIPSSDLAAVNLDFMELEACSLGSCVQTWLPTAALCTDAGVRVRVFVAASRHFNDCVCVATTSRLSKACSWRHYLTWWCWIYERTKCVANCSVLTLLCLPQVPPEH